MIQVGFRMGPPLDAVSRTLLYPVSGLLSILCRVKTKNLVIDSQQTILDLLLIYVTIKSTALVYLALGLSIFWWVQLGNKLHSLCLRSCLVQVGVYQMPLTQTTTDLMDPLEVTNHIDKELDILKNHHESLFAWSCGVLYLKPKFGGMH